MAADVRTQGLSARPVRPAELRRRAERMLAMLRLEHAELSVLMTNDAVIRRFNREYRGMDRPTDVLAFALWEPDEGERIWDVGPAAIAENGPPKLLGDVIISLETARRQAGARGAAIADEVTFLLAHGLLHLLGLDHRDRDEERRMHALGDILQFAATGRPPAPRRFRGGRLDGPGDRRRAAS